jgi:predicted  nucleic acid-binding Zn-ribbon protein
MRSLVLPLLAVALIVTAVAAVSARAEGEPADLESRFTALQLEVRALQAEIDFLKAREDSLSKYATGLSNVSQTTRAAVGQARSAGFEAAAIPANSRVAVLVAIERLANDISSGVPVASPAEQELRRRADVARRAAGLK